MLCPLTWGISAFYDISVRRLAFLAAGFLLTFPRENAIALS